MAPRFAADARTGEQYLEAAYCSLMILNGKTCVCSRVCSPDGIHIHRQQTELHCLALKVIAQEALVVHRCAVGNWRLMVKLKGIYGLRWCGFLRDCKGCRKNAPQPGLPARCTTRLHHSSHANVVRIDGNNLHHVTVLVRGCVHTEGTVEATVVMGAYHNVSRLSDF